MRRVAITGLGAVTPVGNNADTFFESICGGVCGIAPITRFDTTDFKIKNAAEVKDFDPGCCYENQLDAKKADRFTQYAMAAASEAVNASGIIGNVDPRRLGVYIGSGIGGMDTFVSEAYKLRDKGPSRVSPFFIPMMIGNMAAGAVAIRFGARGATLPVVTACATSTNALGEAYRAIACSAADAIIAGGAESTVHPLAIAGFTNMRALSDESLPFDKRRCGFVLGEGAGILVLEEYSHALSRGAEILGEITGYGNTCDAYHITSPSPDGEGAAAAMSLAASEAGITGSESIYINAHGTGTPMNDRTETLAIKKALGENAYRAFISSTKSMTGHMLGAAGAVEAIACVLALKNGILPPTINLDEPDEECDLNYIPKTAIRQQADYALSNSLGFGGHNACLAFSRVR